MSPLIMVMHVLSLGTVSPGHSNPNSSSQNRLSGPNQDHPMTWVPGPSKQTTTASLMTP